ncbi:MAG: extracellular solute-binding protein [Thermomicrobiales bacterium]
MIQKGLSRRDMLKIAGATGGAAALGGLGGLRPGTIRAQAGAYEGVTIRGLGQAGTAWVPAVEQFAKDFNATTGGTVEWDLQPWEQLMPKLQADLAAGSPTYDFFCADIEFQYTIYPALLPINDLIESSGYDMGGVLPSRSTSTARALPAVRPGCATDCRSRSGRPGSSIAPISSLSSQRPGPTTMRCWPNRPKTASMGSPSQVSRPS